MPLSAFGLLVLFVVVFGFLSCYLLDCYTVQQLWDPINTDREGVSSKPLAPEAAVSLTWMQRASSTAIQAWYNTNEKTSHSQVLNASWVKEGNVAMPLHTFYLYFIGEVLEHSFEYLAGLQSVLDVEVLRKSSLVITSLCSMFCLVVWKLSRVVTRLVVSAVRDREELVEVEGLRVISSFTVVQRERLVNYISTGVCVFVLFIGLVPLFALEVITLSPTFCAVQCILWAILLLLQEEVKISTPRNDLSDFDTTTPLVTQEKIRIYALKEHPSVVPIPLASVLVVLSVLFQVQFTLCAPAMLLWVFTACVRRGNKRVVVLMDMEKEGTVEAEVVGFSVYRDTMSSLTSLCFVSASIFGLVFLTTGVFWWGKGGWFRFASLFGRRLPSTDSVEYSVSGAVESSDKCLYGLPSNTCMRPTPNMWFLLEAYEFPVTSTMKRVARAIGMGFDTQSVFDIIVVLLVVLANMGLFLLCLFYRLGTIPLSFSSPKECQDACIQQQKSYDEYWKNKKKKVKTDESKKDAAKMVKTVTPITAEEYILKHLSVLGWLLIGSCASAIIFVPRLSPLSMTAIFPGFITILCIYTSVFLVRLIFPAPFQSSVNHSVWCILSPAFIATVHDLPCMFFVVSASLLSLNSVFAFHISERVRVTAIVFSLLMGSFSIRRFSIEFIGVGVLGYIFSIVHFSTETNVPTAASSVEHCALSLALLTVLGIRSFTRVFDLVASNEEIKLVPIEQQLGALR